MQWVHEFGREDTDVLDRYLHYVGIDIDDGHL
jgi:hypothetical protein